MKKILAIDLNNISDQLSILVHTPSSREEPLDCVDDLNQALLNFGFQREDHIFQDITAWAASIRNNPSTTSVDLIDIQFDNIGQLLAHDNVKSDLGRFHLLTLSEIKRLKRSGHHQCPQGRAFISDYRDMVSHFL